MGCTFNNLVVHSENNTSSDESHYVCLHPSCFPCPPSCRCESVGSSGGRSSGQGVRDVCDCAQEGQPEVCFVSLSPLCDFHVALWFPAAAMELFISASPSMIFVFLLFFSSYTSPSGLFVRCHGEAFTA